MCARALISNASCTRVHTPLQLVRRLCDDRDVVLYVDLHGHSRKMNIFMYGCENRGTWSLRLRERVFPRMLWRNATCFSYDDCNFKVSRCRWNRAAWHKGCDHSRLCVCIFVFVLGWGCCTRFKKQRNPQQEWWCGKKSGSQTGGQCTRQQ